MPFLRKNHLLCFISSFSLVFKEKNDGKVEQEFVFVNSLGDGHLTLFPPLSAQAMTT